MRQGKVLDKGAYSHLLELCLGSFETVIADAGAAHCRLPKQNTGGSDALCLGPPPVSVSPKYHWQKYDHQNKYRMNLESNLLTKKGMLLC
jgi:hypothetical protein